MIRALAILYLAGSAQAYEITGKVIKVADGDTVTIMTAEYAKHKIRLYGIDAPEDGQPYGFQAKQLLSKLIAGQSVTADCIEKDRYNRDVCTIYKGSVDINATMVASGGAWVYRKYYKGTAYFTYEKQAKDNRRGLWKTSEAQRISPSDWRKGKVSSSYYNSDNSVPIKLSKNGICHAVGTKHYNRTKHFKQFENIDDCLNFGRLPRG